MPPTVPFFLLLNGPHLLIFMLVFMVFFPPEGRHVMVAMIQLSRIEREKGLMSYIALLEHVFTATREYQRRECGSLFFSIRVKKSISICAHVTK